MKRNIMRLFDALVIVMLLFSFGCKKREQPAAQTLSGTQEYTNNDSRFTIKRVAVVYDDLAYSSARGVYLIRDTKTGKEYFGLSGVGISELGSHGELRGKITVQVPDER